MTDKDSSLSMPDNPTITELETLFHNYLAAENFIKAREAAQQAVENYSNDAKAYILMGVYFLAQGNQMLALPWLRAAMTRNGVHPWLLIEILKCYQTIGYVDGIIDVCSRLRIFADDDQELLFSMSLLLADHNCKSEAIKCLNKILSIEADNSDAIKLLATLNEQSELT